MADAEIVTVFQVDLGMAVFRSLLGCLALLPSADFLAVNLRDVEADDLCNMAIC